MRAHSVKQRDMMPQKTGRWKEGKSEVLPSAIHKYVWGLGCPTQGKLSSKIPSLVNTGLWKVTEEELFLSECRFVVKRKGTHMFNYFHLYQMIRLKRELHWMCACFPVWFTVTFFFTGSIILIHFCSVLIYNWIPLHWLAFILLVYVTFVHFELTSGH